MAKHLIPIQIRWTDIDANRHVKHSSYYDFGAIMRMSFFVEHGLTVNKMSSLGIGPVLFREEAVFRREIRFEDKLTIDVELTKAASDFSRWSIRHRIYIGGETLAAILTVDGAWIDLSRRKLAVPDDFVKDVFSRFPRSDDFQEIELSKGTLKKPVPEK